MRPRPSRALRAITLAVLALAFGPARAHETLHEVRRGQAIAVRAYHPGGQPVRGAFQVFSPAAPDAVFLRGRTDPAGWVAFVPAAPGEWRVKIAGDHGHGIDVRVEAEAPAVLPAAAPGAVSPAPAPSLPQAPSGPGPIAAFVLRPLLGVAAIGAVFALLFLAWRRKGAP